MRNIVEALNQEQLEKLSAGKKIDDFAPGDSINVRVRIIEGDNERIQAFEGICIARKNSGLQSSFTVRKISHGEGVERVFPLYSPRIEAVELIRRGEVRRAKLYYLRGLTGKAARIRERMDFNRAQEIEATVQEAVVQPSAEEKAAQAEAKKAKKAAKAESAAKPAKKAKK